MAGGARSGAAQDEPRLVTGDLPTVATHGAKILAVGGRDEVLAAIGAAGLDRASFDEIDAAGGTITPGLIDPHTHLLFAGTREGEVRLRQRGHGYLEILAAGGGILSTVAKTRAASAEELTEHGRCWLARMLEQGTTTVEAKSGYGLDTATELRLLEVYRALAAEGPVEIVPTYLGAHAVPPEHRGRAGGIDAYVDQVVDRDLPAVAEQGIARFCDVFCEAGVFDEAQSQRVLEAGIEHGLRPRLHADELVASGGAELAADLNAASADHLAAISPAGLDALAAAAARGRATVATLLPATTLFLMSDHYAPARKLIERGVPVALGTDFNPGTSPTASLPLVLSLACLKLRLTPAEALAGVTINAAAALGLDATHGSLEPGKQADLVIWDVPSHELLPYWVGARLARTVVKKGQLCVLRSAD